MPCKNTAIVYQLFSKKLLFAIFFACSLMSAFAQDEPEKLAEPEKFAVYVSGAGDAGINKALGNKLLAVIEHNGKYAEIGDWEAAKQYGADFVCEVSIAEVFGAYSISARLVRTHDSKVIKTALLDRSLKSLDDLTIVSNELAVRLLQLQLPEPVPPALSAAPNEPASPSPVAEETKKECMAQTPCEHSVALRSKDESVFSLGFRAGFNLSHLYATYLYAEGSYKSIPGFQLGLVLDIASNDWLHIQPGLMYIQKGTEDITSHYIEIPFLLSLKYSALRVNAGPYIGICIDAVDDYIANEVDFGVSAGFGFDVGIFYLGAFYNYGLIDVSNRKDFDFYNRTLGFNFGVNL